MEKKLLNVRILTHPNGYGLTVDKNEYLYYNLEELLEGFMYHIGLEELQSIDNETIKEFIAAAVVWRADNGETAKEIVRLREENKTLANVCAKLKKSTKRLRDKAKEKDYDEDSDDE